MGLLSLSQPTVSKHLKALHATPDWSSPAPRGSAGSTGSVREPLREVDEWLGSFRQGWAASGDGRVSALERHLQIMGDADGGL